MQSQFVSAVGASEKQPQFCATLWQFGAPLGLLGAVAGICQPRTLSGQLDPSVCEEEQGQGIGTRK